MFGASISYSLFCNEFYKDSNIKTVFIFLQMITIQGRLKAYYQGKPIQGKQKIPFQSFVNRFGCSLWTIFINKSMDQSFWIQWPMRRLESIFLTFTCADNVININSPIMCFNKDKMRKQNTYKNTPWKNLWAYKSESCCLNPRTNEDSWDLRRLCGSPFCWHVVAMFGASTSVIHSLGKGNTKGFKPKSGFLGLCGLKGRTKGRNSYCSCDWFCFNVNSH